MYLAYFNPKWNTFQNFQKYHSDDSYLSKCEFASSLWQWLLLKILIPTKFMIVPTPLHLQQHSLCAKYYSDISCEVLKVFWPGTQSCGVLCPMLNEENESDHLYVLLFESLVVLWVLSYPASHLHPPENFISFEFVANVLHDNMGMIIFDLRACGGQKHHILAHTAGLISSMI